MISLFKVNMPLSASAAVLDVLTSGFVADGDNVEEFEKMLGDFIGNPNVVTVNSEANGILLSLFMAGIRPGDEVIASPMACTASTMPILNLFAQVKWCDVNPYTGMMDPDKLELYINKKTKAVLFTHWAGEVAEIKKINDIAHRHSLKVIEDASEAFSAKFHGKYLGNHDSDYTVYSFGPVKHITTIDGGAIFFKDKDEYLRAKDLKRFGINRESFRDDLGEISKNSDIPLQGYNFYMNNVCASIGTEQLKVVDNILSKYYKNGNFYKNELSSIEGLTMLERNEDNQPSYWVFTLLAENRDELLIKLREREIYASKIHLRNDIYSCYKTGVQNNLNGTKYFSDHVLCIPSGWWITEEKRVKIIHLLKQNLKYI